MTTQEFVKITAQKPHLFILGAGATKACIPDGDKNHRATPVMNDFLKTIGKEDILDGILLETTSKNIEIIYSELHDNIKYKPQVKAIEVAIEEYFAALELPHEPTLYDYLILSLREKDCIATFNWDPLLVQAYARVRKITKNLPRLAFLHGNVAVGVCKECYTYSPLYFKNCPECENALESMPLLFPIKKKDYSSSWSIKGFWEVLNKVIENAALVTIWGYSAPESDSGAKAMMLKAFSSSFRKLDQLEVIDIADQNEVKKKWEEFSKETNWHIDVLKNLSNTYLWEFPRRSVEGYAKRNIGGWWGESTLTLKEDLTWSELTELVQPLLEQEENNSISVI